MSFPTGAPVIDLHLGIPVSEHKQEWYDSFRPLLRDRESREQFEFPAQHLFKTLPRLAEGMDYLDAVVAEMDRFNIVTGLIGVSESFPYFDRIAKSHRDRFLFCMAVDPNRGMDEVRRIRRMHQEHKIAGVAFFPAGSVPQVPINDKRLYPIYATCCELDLPILINVGVPGPRIPMATQHVELVDEVCWFFPELKFVMRHGADPWVDLAVKLMLKYPNLYYSTSAWAPRHYPKAIIDYANTRGADKIMYAGYFPVGLSLERIFSEFPQVGFKDAVWPRFLHDNAAKLFGLPRVVS